MPEIYLSLKLIHVSAALISIMLFTLRGIWMMVWPHLLQRRAVRVLQHMVDTILLASALVLAWQTGRYPFMDGWLTAKIIALPVYIALGSIALKHGSSRSVRISAWLLALGTFAYIVAVAVTKQVIPF